MSTDDRNKLLTTDEVAHMLGCDPRTLKARRMRNYRGEPGPPWTRVLGRVYYKKGGVLDYLESREGARPARPRRVRIPAAPTTVVKPV